MKTALSLIAALALGLSASAQPVVTVTPSNVGGFDYFVINVDPNGTVIDTINLEAIATVGTFDNVENVAGTVLFAPALTSPDTDILGLSTVAVGLTVVGEEDSNTRLSAAIANLNGTISQPGDIAQLVLNASEAGGTYQVRFAFEGQEVGQAQSGTFGVPEPGSLALLGLGGMALLRRRR